MPADVLTNRYSNSRTGVTSGETRLTKGRISTSTFGKLFARTVDGELYAQPLIVSNLEIGGVRRNVVYLATSRNYVYAYDADDPLAYLPLWTTNLGPAVPRDAIFPGYGNFASEVGVTSTPVIERKGEGGTIFLVAKTMRFTQLGQTVFQYKLHALNILTGNEKRKPTLIEAAVQNTAGRAINFDPQLNLNRPGLLLQDGVLYIAFGSHGDKGDFYGWVMAYNARTLSRIAVYNTAPDWGQGGIWQSGTGLAGDNEGNVYAVVGNGAKHPSDQWPTDVNSPVYGNALLKLKLVKPRKGPAKLKVVDWFTASDVFALNDDDNDFIGGPVLFEAPQTQGEELKLLLGGGKDGKFYLVNRDNLGKWKDRTNTNILQAEQLCTFHIHGAPVVWRRANGDTWAFVWSEKDFLKAFALKGTSFDKTPLSTSDYGLPQDELRMPGGVLALSWNGKDNDSAILWASHPTHEDAMNKTVSGTLRAYDALDLNNELWTSDTDADGNDRVGCLAKFCPPVIANGKVYLGTFSRELVVYGLFEDAGKLARADRADDVGIFQLRDIGPVQKSGSYVCSRYDLKIVGSGICETQDEFLLASVERNLAKGAIEVTARVDGIKAPDCPNARAGVMIRRSFDQNERFAAVTITNQNQALFLHRDERDKSVKQDGPIDVTLPFFVRVVAKSVNTKPGHVEFAGAISEDGADWHPISALTEIEMDVVADIDLRAGLAVTAQTGPNVKTPASQAHAIFSRVKVV